MQHLDGPKKCSQRAGGQEVGSLSPSVGALTTPAYDSENENHHQLNVVFEY